MGSMAEGSEQDGRRKLLDKLSGVYSRVEAADARAEAERWMARHPDDEEVRRAVDRLQPAEGEEDLGGEHRAEEDLEEGSPT